MHADEVGASPVPCQRGEGGGCGVVHHREVVDDDEHLGAGPPRPTAALFAGDLCGGHAGLHRRGDRLHGYLEIGAVEGKTVAIDSGAVGPPQQVVIRHDVLQSRAFEVHDEEPHLIGGVTAGQVGDYGGQQVGLSGVLGAEHAQVPFGHEVQHRRGQVFLKSDRHRPR